MGCNLGPISISNINGSSNVEFGNTVFISPKSISKTYSGSGSGDTGFVVRSNNGISITNTVDSNLINQPFSINE